MSAKTLCLNCGALRDGRSVEYPFPIGEPVPVVPGAVELSECVMCEGDDKRVKPLVVAAARPGRRAA